MRALKSIQYWLIILITIGSFSFIPIPTKMDDITSSTWKIVKSKISPPLDTNGDTTSNFLSLYPSCVLDDYNVFRSDSIAELYDSENLCDTLLGESPYPTKWYFDSTQTKVYFKPIYFAYEPVDSVSLILLNSDSLVTSYLCKINGEYFTLENTYIHPE